MEEQALDLQQEVTEQDKYVFFELGHEVYGIRTEYVLEMVILKHVTPMPQSQEFIRGVFNLRGIVIPVMDLRSRLHLNGIFDEVDGVVEILQARKQDHINWLNELKASVEEERPFTLQMDPHKCAFGKWYDHYKADNSLLRMQLQKFDQPHRAIHGLASKVRKLVEDEGKEVALEEIERAWNNQLAEMITLFDETDEFVRSNTREIVLVCKLDETTIGLVVDNVIDVRDITQDQIDFEWSIGNGNGSSRYIYGMAKLEEEVRILIDFRKLLDG